MSNKYEAIKKRITKWLYGPSRRKEVYEKCKSHDDWIWSKYLFHMKRSREYVFDMNKKFDEEQKAKFLEDIGEASRHFEWWIRNRSRIHKAIKVRYGYKIKIFPY